VSRRLAETLAREAELLDEVEVTKTREVSLHSEIIRLSRFEDRSCPSLKNRSSHHARLNMAYSLQSTVMPTRAQTDLLLKAMQDSQKTSQLSWPSTHSSCPAARASLSEMVDRLLKENRSL
jgi:hypothetical protein